MHRRSVLFAAPLLLALAMPAQAITFYHPPDATTAGVSEIETYGTDALVSELTALATVLPTIEATAQGAATAGVDTLITNNFRQINIPASYALDDVSLVRVIVPYVQRTQWNDTASGLGDITVQGSYTLEQGSERTLQASLAVKAPTGDDQKTVGFSYLPLGTGSWDFLASASGVMPVGPYRAAASLGLRYNTENSDGLQHGSVLTYMVGGDYGLGDERIRVSATLSGIVRGATRFKGSSVNDDLKTLDLTPGIQYRHSSTLGARAGLKIPVWEQVGSGYFGGMKRSVVFEAGITGAF